MVVQGPHAKCKHIAAVLLMMIHFISTGDVQIEKCCTDNLQTFHKPKAYYKGNYWLRNIKTVNSHLNLFLRKLPVEAPAKMWQTFYKW